MVESGCDHIEESANDKAQACDEANPSHSRVNAKCAQYHVEDASAGVILEKREELEYHVFEDVR